MKKHLIFLLAIISLIVLFQNTNQVSAATTTTVTAPVTINAESAGYNSIKITWGAVSGVDGYQVYRSTSLTGTYSYLTATTSKSYSNTGLTTGKSYYYKVKAYKISKSLKVYSKYTGIVNAKPVPASPSSLAATSSSYNSAKLSWKSVNGATGYELYRSTSSNGTYSKVKATSSTSYNNSNLAVGNTYYYKVRAYKTVNSTNIYGKFSTIANIKPLLSIPTNLNASFEGDKSIKLSWDLISGASGYRVYRSTSDSGSYSFLKNATSTSYEDTDLIDGTTYYYKIRAYRTEGTVNVYSNYSDAVEITVPEVDYSAASKNIAGEFTTLADGVIAILTNNNSYPVSLTATMVFYDETGLMLDQSVENNYYFDAGKQYAIFFNGPTDSNYDVVSYSSYKIVYSTESTEYKESHLSDIQITSNLGSDNVMVAVSNLGSKTSDFNQVGIVFYKDGKAVAYDYSYAECEAPGSTDYLEFSLPNDENFDPIPFDNYQIFINFAYSYVW